MDKILSRAGENKFFYSAFNFVRAFFFNWRDGAWVIPIWVLILGGGYVVFDTIKQAQQTEAAEDAEKDAISRADKQQEMRASLEPLVQTAYDAAEKNGQTEVTDNLLRILETLGSERRKKDFKTNVEPADTNVDDQNAPPIAISKSDAQSSEKANIPPVPRGQIVYIQFAGSLTHGHITNLNKALKAADWKAQGRSGERIETANGLNEVRYSGGNRAAAEELARALDESRLPGAPVTVKPLPIIAKTVLEVWISR